jgi:hypothetical protein
MVARNWNATVLSDMPGMARALTSGGPAADQPSGMSFPANSKRAGICQWAAQAPPRAIDAASGQA